MTVGTENNCSHEYTISGHTGPLITDERALEVWVNYHPSYGNGFEKMFVSEPDSGTWKLLNIPYYAHGLKLGSIVEISNWQIVGVTSTPDELSWRLAFSSEVAKNSALSNSKLEDVAFVDQMFTTFAAIQARPGYQSELEAIIREWLDHGLLEFTEDVMLEPFERGALMDEGLDTDYRIWEPQSGGFVPIK
jgi:hypothetical protein